ncbi:uncharacterized protein ARMOST_22590 [Armillaria ostoyae]|uniref:Uncharacterized protein n=1 Tax=Armillaria ostoyae TaxID=47428 RepID=A0A284SDC0_ARMOS|nr:uncharacterized protein ARMOST_22590 [Armillaria ostoyae]
MSCLPRIALVTKGHKESSVSSSVAGDLNDDFMWEVNMRRRTHTTSTSAQTRRSCTVHGRLLYNAGG